jgi:hypothetical protein
MTEKELLSLERFDKVKFVGSSLKLYKNWNADKTLIKGKIYTLSGSCYADSYSTKAIRIHLYGLGTYEFPGSCVVDWELAEKRSNLIQGQIKSKMGLSYSKRVLKKFHGDLSRFMSFEKSKFDMYLNDIHLDKKMDFLGKLSGDDKIIAEMLFEFTTIEDLLKTWEKGRNS